MVMRELVRLGVHAVLMAEWMPEPTRRDAKTKRTQNSTCNRRPLKDLPHRLIIIAATWGPEMTHLRHAQLQQLPNTALLAPPVTPSWPYLRVNGNCARSYSLTALNLHLEKERFGAGCPDSG